MADSSSLGSVVPMTLRPAVARRLIAGPAVRPVGRTGHDGPVAAGPGDVQAVLEAEDRRYRAMVDGDDGLVSDTPPRDGRDRSCTLRKLAEGATVAG